jgi:hypothetical protein
MGLHRPLLLALRRMPPAGPLRPFGVRIPGRRGAYVVTLLAGLLYARAASAAKTDVVVLDNEDHLTGEIKGMSRGKVDFKTDDAGRISIEWTKVAQVTSIHAFEIELASSKKYYGSLRSPADKQLWVGTNAADVFPMAEVVSITPMDEWFWARVRAYLDLGFTLAKSNKALTLSSDGEFAYRGEHFGGAFDFNTYLQDDANSKLVAQWAVTLTGTYFFTRWRAQLQFGATHNDELDLTLRLDIGGGAAYPVLRNHWMELWVSGGLLGVRELYTAGEPNLNLAAYVGADWVAFRYDTPKLDAEVSVQLLPILTELWRTRGDATVRVKYELFSDFYVGINFSFTFDTQPPDPTAAHTDYLLSLTIGWSYRR